MNIKTIILLIIINFQVSIVNCYSQVKQATIEEYNHFLHTTTLVVKDDKELSFFNDILRDNLKKFWHITPYSFIQSRTFKTQMKDEDFSFIILSDAVYNNTKYNVLNLVLANKNAKDLNSLHDIGSVPLSSSDADEDTYLYKLGGVLQFMQYLVTYKIAHPEANLLKLIINSSGDFTGKELWLLKEEVSQEINSEAKVKNLQSSDLKSVIPIIRFVTQDDIKKAIDERNEKVAFLHKVGPGEDAKSGICWIFIVSAKDGSLLYSSSHKITSSEPDALLKSDIQKMSQAK
jgi:hypothetical protein